MRLYLAGAAAPVVLLAAALPAQGQELLYTGPRAGPLPAPRPASPEALAGAVRDLTARLEAQEQQLIEQRAELDRLKGLAQASLDDMRGTGPQEARTSQIARGQAQASEPPEPVGERPPPAKPAVDVAALPEQAGVLTPKGRFVLDQSFDYTHASTNRLVFRGVEIVTGIQIGVIEASDADRNVTAGIWALRYGLTNRLEVEARVPYLYRADQVTTLSQRDNAATRTFDLEGKDFGDLEATVRYQINSGAKGWPVFIGNLRVKSDTGTNPFTIPRDEFGVSTALATGSGFWGIEPGLSVLYPTDPAVLFGTVSYLAHLPGDIDREIGDVFVGRVNPGDALTASAGFGFALNPRFSFSLGYKHSYIWPTKTELGDTLQKSTSLVVGAATLGWSFRLTDQVTLSNTYEVGTTGDAPDMHFVFRVPVAF